jgi:aminoglycoside 3-N-acetyltransferase
MHTIDSLHDDLRRLGVTPGGVLIMHSGFRPLGAVENGPDGVVEAVVRAVRDGGTVMVPTFTTNLIDPRTWPVPPSPEERERLLASIEPFHPEQSAPHKMGAVATAFWRRPDARRSLHPVTSWAAIGPRAEELTCDHPLEDPEGIDGPVGRAYHADAQVLLLGVGHDADTTIHLAESVLDMPHLYALPDHYLVVEHGRRHWRPVTKTTKCSDGFVKLEPHLERADVVRRGKVGDADSQLLRSRDIVRVATDLLGREPTALLCDDPECVHCPTSRELLGRWQPAAAWRLPA